MTFEERVRALRPLDLPPRQTAFLVTVALHGGYCVRRQYDAFVGRGHGQIVCDFFESLVTRGLMHRFLYQPNRGAVYHLQTKALYAALDQRDNRNRRHVSPMLIARKLMVLDYVLAAPAAEWFATEQDKVALFTRRFGVALIDLPQRRYEPRDPARRGTTRYFIHKLPVCLTADDDAVHLVFLVQDETGAGLAQFLEDHLRLLSRLPAWVVVAVCPRHLEGLPACRAVFAKMFGAARHASAQHDPDDLRWFFRARQAVDANDLRDLSVKDIDRFRDLRRMLSGAAIERLYVTWQREGDAALRDLGVQMPTPTTAPERLMTYELPNRYTQFGKLPGLA
jgi:hypothetical protein